MSLIKKPAEIQPKTNCFVLLYGQPSAGKTTLACGAKDAVLLDFDGGVTRINVAHQIDTLQVQHWEDVTLAMPELAPYATIVVDTIGKMNTCVEAYIKRTSPNMVQRDGSLSLKGYGMRKKIFNDFQSALTSMGKNLIYIAHESEDRSGDQVCKRPLMGGKHSESILGDLDLVGYCQFIGNKRTLTFSACESYYAKDCCNFPPMVEIPQCVDEVGNASDNNFMETIFDKFRESQSKRLVMAKECNALVDSWKERIESATDAESINALLPEYREIAHVGDSKVRIGTALNNKAKALGLTFDKKGGLYV